MADVSLADPTPAPAFLQVWPQGPISELAAARVVAGVLLLADHARVWADGPLAALQDSVTASLSLRQAHYYCDARGQPLAFCNWAFVNRAVLDDVLEGRRTLKPDEYRCGELRYICELIAPFGHCRDVVAGLRRVPGFDGHRVYGRRQKVDACGRRSMRPGFLAFRRGQD